MNGERQVVLVTGSSRGIGLETAIELAARGHLVYASMRDPAKRNAPAAQAIAQRQADVRIIELDVSSKRSARNAVDVVLAREGQLDVVVNNAGIMNWGLIEGFTVEQLAHQMDVNYLGPARLFRAALPAMRQQRRGLFVTVSSLAGRLLFPFLGTYNPSKHAVEALAEMYHYELRGLGVESIIVQPGPFRTGLIDAAPRPADAARLAGYGRLVQTAESLISLFKDMMAEAPEHDPAIVAREIADLIALPVGARPLRTIVGQDYDTGRINEVALEVQEALFDALGLQELKSAGQSAAPAVT